jgi:phospholipid-binding lipoprotein MlaA
MLVFWSLSRGLCLALLVVVFAGVVVLPMNVYASDVDLESMLDDDFDEDYDETEGEARQSIADPLESVNRFFFHFNDKLYYWLVKPTGKVYSALLAEDVRVSISDTFYNILAPVRVVNHLLQGEFVYSGTELSRFVINTTLGAGGLGDPAGEEFGIPRRDSDFGETLGMYGIGDGFYVCWPLFGPSTARDSVGMAVDYFSNPLLYGLQGHGEAAIAMYVWKYENEATLRGEQYETIMREAFDPYVSLRDIYVQYRRGIINNRTKSGALVRKKPDSFTPEIDCPDFNYVEEYTNKVLARRYQQCRDLQGDDSRLVRYSLGGIVYYGTQFPNLH